MKMKMKSSFISTKSIITANDFHSADWLAEIKSRMQANVQTESPIKTDLSNLVLICK